MLWRNSIVINDDLCVFRVHLHHLMKLVIICVRKMFGITGKIDDIRAIEMLTVHMSVYILSFIATPAFYSIYRLQTCFFCCKVLHTVQIWKALTFRVCLEQLLVLM